MLNEIIIEELSLAELYSLYKIKRAEKIFEDFINEINIKNSKKQIFNQNQSRAQK